MIGTQKIIFEDGKLIPVADNIEGEEPLLKFSNMGYALAYVPSEERWVAVHKIVDEYHNGSKPNNLVVHHIDFNKLNNRADNLVRMETKEHFFYHSSVSKQRWQNPKYRAQQIESHLGRRSSQEQIEKTRAKNSGRKRTPQQIQNILEGRSKCDFELTYAKISRKLMGRKLSDDHRQKLSNHAKYWWSLPEFCDAQQKAHVEVMRRRWQNPEFREYMSDLHRRPMSESAKKNMSDGRKGMRFSEEHRKALSEAQKRLWSDPEFKKERTQMLISAKEKAGVMHKSYPMSDATKLKMSISAKNRAPFSEEHRQRLREATTRVWAERHKQQEVEQLQKSTILP